MRIVSISVHECLTVLVLLTNLHSSKSFYLPGLAPVNYCKASESSPTCKVSPIKLYNFIANNSFPDDYNNFISIYRNFNMLNFKRTCQM